MSVHSEISEDVELKTTCYGCPAATCGMIARRVNGTVVSLRGDPECPFSQGKLCSKGHSQIMMAYSKQRVTKPLMRTNPEKGIGIDPKWVEISYDDAIRISAEKLRECREIDPKGFVFANSDFTTLPWFLPSVLVAVGSPNHTSGGRAFCGNNVHSTLQQVHGGFHAGPDFHHTKHVILFGSGKGAMSNWAAVTATFEMSKARRKGMKLVVVDPWCSNAASVADEWVPIRPGTDGALVLSMIHVLVNELGLYDREFLKTLSNGPYLIRSVDGRYARDTASNKPLIWDESDNKPKCYDDPTLVAPAMEGSFIAQGATQSCSPAFQLLKDHLATYPPERVAEITTIPADTIRRLARDFGTAARIGDTIEIDGVTLPLRPACAHWYKGISQHSRSHEQGLSIAMLNTIVGAIDVPGGLSADTVYAHHPEFSEHSTWMGRGSEMREVEGILQPGKISTFNEIFPSPYPPKPVVAPVSMAGDALAPVSAYQSGVLAKINALAPELFNKNIPHNTLFYLQVVSNDLLNEGNSKTQAEFLKKFKFHLSLVPIIDENSLFADIVIPAQTQLERLDFGANNIPDTMGSTGTGEYCINLRQPVVPSDYKHIVDIWADLAGPAGVQAEYNQCLNLFLELQGDWQTKPDQKYSNEEITDRWIRSMTGGKTSLAEMMKVGRLKWKKTVKEMYARSFFTPRIPVYYEYNMASAEKLSGVLNELGIKNWDVSRFKALPDWEPAHNHLQLTNGFDLYGVTYKWPFVTANFSNFNPWLAELGQYNPYAGKIVLNRKCGESKGLRDGDRVCVENESGRKVEGELVLSECIHPECVGMDHHGGNWAKGSLPPRRTDQGVQYSTLLDYDMKNLDKMNGAFEASPKLRISRTN